MSTDVDEMDQRLAAIRYVVQAKQDVGKTKLQKLLYFAQEAARAPLGFEFRLHHYGPYSLGLDDDLVRLKLAGQIKVEPDTDGYGYHVRPVWHADESGHTATPRPEVAAALDRVLKTFGDLQAQQLELKATIHFVCTLSPSCDKSAVLDQVRQLKPKFSPAAIERAYDELIAQHWLPMQSAQGAAQLAAG